MPRIWYKTITYLCTKGVLITAPFMTLKTGNHTGMLHKFWKSHVVKHYATINNIYEEFTYGRKWIWNDIKWNKSKIPNNIESTKLGFGGGMNRWKKHQNVINSCENGGDCHFLSCTSLYF